ncbi:MAG: cytochrome c [Candidatus Competibacteraceae bacterium]|nr:cytochrome c [Candidatus Competibacteraceae bacterium]
MKMLVPLIVLLMPLAVPAQEPELLARGRYIMRAGACDSCHTDHQGQGAFLAGGRALKTRFGTFYAPNLTPDPATGLGEWTLEDFRQAMISGLSPDGSPYYPVFPYRWYTGMTEADLTALWAYLRSIPPRHNPVAEHRLDFPFSVRSVVWAWRLLNFEEGASALDSRREDLWNRGAYLVNHLGHCGACHTPKLMGNFLSGWFLGGAQELPGTLPAPNITPHPTGIQGWSREDVVRALYRAMAPDGSPIRGHMARYVLVGSSYLTEADLTAIARYLETVEPVEQRLEYRPVWEQGEGQRGHGWAGVRSLIAEWGNLTRAK